tara:strand:+ start:481 stop:657 length:177 start_codon:yes stop_codon:yes gene_type:complete
VLKGSKLIRPLGVYLYFDEFETAVVLMACSFFLACCLRLPKTGQVFEWDAETQRAPMP